MTTDIQNEIHEARNGQGNEVRLESCPHRRLLAQSRCRLRLACIEGRYAKRIDRFFDWNQELANNSLTHPYFEVFAVAAKHADVVRGARGPSRAGTRQPRRREVEQ
jgi:hypothetical protein